MTKCVPMLGSKRFVLVCFGLGVCLMVAVHLQYDTFFVAQPLDVRLFGQKVVHPPVELMLNGSRVYYTDTFFVEPNDTAVKHGTCTRYVPEIDPYERGGPSEHYSSGLLPDCAELHFSYRQRLPRVALATAPGSGNTWVRHLIQQLTGIYTGAVYYDTSLIDRGFAGEYHMDPTVMAIKTHEHWNCSLMPLRPSPKEQFPCPHYDKAIMVVREPHGAILAEFNRYTMNEDHLATVNEELFKTESWRRASLLLAKRWVQTIETWSNFGNFKDLNGCLLVISFEQLQSNLKEQLVKLGHFLGVKKEYLQGSHLDCVMKNSKGVFKRHKKVIPFNIYSQEVNTTLVSYKKRINEILTYLKAGFVV